MTNELTVIEKTLVRTSIRWYLNGLKQGLLKANNPLSVEQYKREIADLQSALEKIEKYDD